MANFSEALDTSLDRYGISAKFLAEKSGVPPSTISQFRNGQRRIYSDSLEKIIVALPAEARMSFFASIMGISNFEIVIASLSDAEISDLLILLAKRFSKKSNKVKALDLVSV